uniref:Uncharacterized protein n=1 Tax=Lepeophtheirus salmonis TaxID=72036 RepID=A0A0K2UNS5_LEPSM
MTPPLLRQQQGATVQQPASRIRRKYIDINKLISVV